MLSDQIKKGVNRAPNRSLLFALGLTEEEMSRPLVGIVSSHNEIVPGHMNLDKIAEAVKLGVAMAGGTPVIIPLKAENNFKLTADELRAAITPRTKMLVLPFPNNPTGAIMNADDLEAIAEVLRDTNILEPTSDFPPALSMALSSACTTKLYFVSPSFSSLFQGNSSSEQPLGMPL